MYKGLIIKIKVTDGRLTINGKTVNNCNKKELRFFNDYLKSLKQN